MLDINSNARYLVAQCQQGDRRGCRGTGRTLKMLKKMEPDDIAVFPNEICMKNAIEMAARFDLELAPDNFRVIPVHEEVIVRALKELPNLNKLHLDHHWLDVFFDKSRSKQKYRPLNPSKIGVAPKQLGISKSGLSNKTRPQIAQTLRSGANKLIAIANKIECGEVQL